MDSEPAYLTETDPKELAGASRRGIDVQVLSISGRWLSVLGAWTADDFSRDLANGKVFRLMAHNVEQHFKDLLALKESLDHD